ncbi:MAG TPA: hypothetical protein VLZ03_13725 [Thermodesulfobacteriota bacterium]|nr:hypothetical protein [Thermodesulfobacteriota bacterium]
MNFHAVRIELHRLGNKSLFRVLMSQKESECVRSGLCSFHFKYKGYTFCLSEVLGRGCEVESLKKLEQEIGASKEEDLSQEKMEVPLFKCMKRSA